MNRQYSKFLIPGIIVVGMVLRLPFTSIPPIISDIAKSQHVSVEQLGILTTVPLIAFAVFSSIVPKIAEKLGLERAFALMLLLMTIGSLMRIVNTPFLYFGTLLIGIGIAHMNVLLPSVVRTYFPSRIGPVTSIFVFSMGLATAVGSSLAAPITHATNWHVFVIILTLLLGLALLVWLPNVVFSNKNKAKRATLKSSTLPLTSTRVWQNKYAWMLLFFSGMQSAMFYVIMAWGLTMAIQSGLSATVAGLFVGINALIGLPFALIVPTIIAHFNSRQRQIFVASFSTIGIIGYVLLLVPQDTFGYWLTINLFIGVSTASLFPYVMATFGLKTSTPSQTAQLSGMAQSGGYLIAACGPALFGYGFIWFNSWKPQIIVITVLFIIMTIVIILVEKQDKILK
ncbi:MFS transporter [Leuconostoc carnosum]|uniref:MFS transporter n=1 Tax=Leuconostoc carnosum TaxID=1252 RepID=UPI00123C06D2|nr:MFS transporter [Leuconostoc carnosum]KAA8373467.1 MFS transporter [Leuconostoc carnosum]